jgi:hypothetical protein
MKKEGSEESQEDMKYELVRLASCIDAYPFLELSRIANPSIHPAAKSA